MKRTAKAHWNGTLQEGLGEISTQSTVLTKPNIHLRPALPMALAPIPKN
jgi:hypothetical protein